MGIPGAVPLPGALLCEVASCTPQVWATPTSPTGATCGEQIEWVQANLPGHAAWTDACAFVASFASPQCSGCSPASPPPLPCPSPPSPSPPPTSSKCGGAVNAGAANCEPYLWGPTADASMPCYAYGGPSGPCGLTVTNDANAGLDKPPCHCAGDTFYLWDEPDTQQKSYAWAGASWLAYAQKFSSQISEMRARGVKFTSPLLKADDPAAYLREFLSACGDQCSNQSSDAYIDVVAINPFCGDWNAPAGTAEGCRAGATWVIDQVSSSLEGRPVYMTNWGYLGATTAAEQIPAINATDAFFAPGSPVERVYYFGAIDYGGNTINNFLTSTVESGDRAGSTLGALWAETCASL
ncbi:hypothetical protein AB1Y20_004139 [Prymnesium parvum]|uniref:Asl1-like glycosyl hydrolase catalytic domain-containing protein n=1 Tax=Prymnesium parvum TaxID=97485 RepID=A0AB34J8J6_PRYPA